MSFYMIRGFGADLKDIKSPNSFKPIGLFKAKTIMSHRCKCVFNVFVTFMLLTEVFSTSNNVTSEINPQKVSK